MLSDFLTTQFAKVTKTYTQDGFGGNTVAMTDGTTFYGGLALKSTITDHATRATGGPYQGTETYALITQSDVELAMGDVVKRVNDGMLFRLTENPICPPIGIRFIQADVERVVIP